MSIQRGLPHRHKVCSDAEPPCSHVGDMPAVVLKTGICLDVKAVDSVPARSSYCRPFLHRISGMSIAPPNGSLPCAYAKLVLAQEVPIMRDIQPQRYCKLEKLYSRLAVDFWCQIGDFSSLWGFLHLFPGSKASLRR